MGMGKTKFSLLTNECNSLLTNDCNLRFTTHATADTITQACPLHWRERVRTVRSG